MAYIFPDIEKRVYSKTFLKDVHVKFCFKKIKTFPDLSTFLGEEFQLSGDNIIGNEHVVTVNSNNGLIKFDFADEYCCVRMRYPAYCSFENLKPWLSKLFKYLLLLNVSSLDSLSICKYNELGYEIKGDNCIKLVHLLEPVFSDELRSRHSEQIEEAEANFEMVSRWEVLEKFSEDNPLHSSLFCEFGYNRKKASINTGVLTLRLTIEVAESIDVQSIDNVLVYLDKILFNSFYWCINKNFIKKMEK